MAQRSAGRDANDGIARSFDIPEAPCWSMVPLKAAPFSCIRLQRRLEPGETFDVELPVAAAYFLMLCLEDGSACNVVAAASKTALRAARAGSIFLFNLAEGTSLSLESTLDAIAFVLPYALFEEMNELLPQYEIQELQCQWSVPDDVMHNLGIALAPFFSGAISPAVVRHVSIAICAHLIENYTVPVQRGHMETVIPASWLSTRLQ